MEQPRKIHYENDIGITSFIVAMKLAPFLGMEFQGGNRYSFSFDVTGIDINAIVEDYFAGTTKVSPKSIVETMREMKGCLYTAKKIKENLNGQRQQASRS